MIREWYMFLKPQLCVIKKLQKSGLSKTNVLENENDIYIKKVMEYYQISDDDIFFERGR